MDCQEFQHLLNAFPPGDLPPEQRAAAAAHRQACATCRRLAELLEIPLREPPDPGALAGEILARTSGAACDRAESNLPELLDGLLPAGSSELVAGHLEHCRRCRALARTMTELRQPLREMAALDPGTGFTAAVLCATCGEAAVNSAVAAGRGVPSGGALGAGVRRGGAFGAAARASLASLARGSLARRPAWWRELLRRPRIAMEAAYTFTLLLILLCGLPSSPFREVPARSLAMADANPVQLLAGFAGALRGRGEAAGGQLVMEALSGGGGRAAGGEAAWYQGWLAGAVARRHLVQVPLADLRAHGRSLGGALRRGELTEVRLRMQVLSSDLVALWQAVRGRPVAAGEPAANPAPQRQQVLENREQE